jgi:hypothetical protein
VPACVGLKLKTGACVGAKKAFTACRTVRKVFTPFGNVDASRKLGGDDEFKGQDLRSNMHVL